ncbi:MAG: HAD family hydrolase [Candidatus Aenigmarchaeota archaeon]|nr:HAD family hydrolase [Candidatus Aenigmarchaeota archaeon]
MLKVIAFDWDDVITLGAKDGYTRCYHETLQELGVILKPKEEKARIMARWSEPHREKFGKLLKENPTLLDKACRIYEEKLLGDTFVKNLSLVSGVNKLLERLSKKYILCVATGQHPYLLKNKVIPKFSIPNVFSQIVSSYEINDPDKHKPHPHILNLIMEKQKVLPEEMIFVGDAKGDVQAARAAGVEPVVVLTGHLTKSQAEELGVRHIIQDVTKLEAVLPKI